jgi:phenylacetic acid degradation operon negative regulatory protein
VQRQLGVTHPEEPLVTAPASPDPSGPSEDPSRRRDSGAASARALLLTILGEFVLPRDEPVWTAAFLQALGAVGVEEKAARQALARTCTAGLIEPVRVGRRTRWQLTGPGRHLLQDGARRIYGFMREPRPWDGRWLVLAITVPEARRQLRHRLRSRLTWAGLGSPAPGLWVVPDAGRADEVAAIVSELGIEADAMSWVGPSAPIGRPEDVVAAAWTSLPQVERAYHAFVADFGGRRADGGAEAFVAQVELVQAWRGFPFLDPALPAELLDHDWPGPQAAAAFHRLHDRWHRRAQAHWDAVCADSATLA